MKERERLLEENERAIELHQMNLALFAEQQQQHQQMQLQQQQPHRYPATPAPGTYNWSPSMWAMLAVPPPPPTPFFPFFPDRTFTSTTSTRHSNSNYDTDCIRRAALPSCPARWGRTSGLPQHRNDLPKPLIWQLSVAGMCQRWPHSRQ